MDFAVQIVGYMVGLPLEILVVDAMRRAAAYRLYPFVFLYVIADFITTVMEIQPSLAFMAKKEGSQHPWSTIYWRDQWIMQALVFLLVLSLLYRASAQIGPRRTMLLGLICATLLFAAVSLMLDYTPNTKIGRWMTPWTRDLNFCAAILDLGLWALLISSKEKDYRLLMVSGALGVQFAARAMGEALRGTEMDTVIPFSPALRIAVAGIMIMCANLACTYIWWQAFRPPKKPTNTFPKKQAA